MSSCGGVSLFTQAYSNWNFLAPIIYLTCLRSLYFSKKKNSSPVRSKIRPDCRVQSWELRGIQWPDTSVTGRGIPVNHYTNHYRPLLCHTFWSRCYEISLLPVYRHLFCVSRQFPPLHSISCPLYPNNISIHQWWLNYCGFSCALWCGYLAGKSTFMC